MVCGVLERGRRRVVYPCSDREGSQALGLRIRRTHPHRGRLGSGSCFGQGKCTSLCWVRSVMILGFEEEFWESELHLSE